MAQLFQPKTYQLRIISAWFVNLSAGWFASIFFLLNQPWLLTLSILLAILFLYLSMKIEEYLENL